MYFLNLGVKVKTGYVKLCGAASAAFSLTHLRFSYQSNIFLKSSCKRRLGTTPMAFRMVIVHRRVLDPARAFFVGAHETLREAHFSAETGPRFERIERVAQTDELLHQTLILVLQVFLLKNKERDNHSDTVYVSRPLACRAFLTLFVLVSRLFYEWRNQMAGQNSSTNPMYYWRMNKNSPQMSRPSVLRCRGPIS